MAVRMASLKRSPSGSWTSRKVIPADVRHAFGKIEDKPTWPANLTEQEARLHHARWLSALETQISRVRATKPPSAPSIAPEPSNDAGPSNAVSRERELHVANAAKAAAATEALKAKLFSMPRRGLNASEQKALRRQWRIWLAGKFWDLPDDRPENWAGVLESTEPDHNALPDDWGRFAWEIDTPHLNLMLEFLGEQGFDLSQQSMQEFQWNAIDELRDFASDCSNHIAGLQAHPLGRYAAVPMHGELATLPKEDAKEPLSIVDTLERFLTERQPKPKTAKKYRSCIAKLIKFLGHDDANLVTKHDIHRWKEHLLHEEKIEPRTFRDGHLVACNVTFNWARDNALLTSNPAETIKVRVPKKDKTREPDLSPQEAQIILGEASKIKDDTPRTGNAVRRWVPWLCAYTGARVGEITQLRSKDIKCADGVHYLHITPDAGSVKTGEFRNVPLHDHIIQQGFLKFVERCGDEPLFYDPEKAQGGDAENPQHKKAGERLAAWVRKIGVDDEEVDPNHGWRHRFKTEARNAGIDRDAHNAITGHKSGDEGSQYGSWSVAALKRELDKLPTIKLQSCDRVT